MEDRLEFRRSKSLNKPVEITSCAEQEETNGVTKEELLPGGGGRGADQVMPTQGRRWPGKTGGARALTK